MLYDLIIIKLELLTSYEADYTVNIKSERWFWITNSMDLSPSWQTDKHSAGQAIPRLLMEPEFSL